MFSKDRELPPNTVRWFGLSLGAMFQCFAVILWLRFSANVPAIALSLFGLLLTTVYYAFNSLQQPIIRAFFKVTWPIAVLISTFCLAILYYGIVTPIGLALRILGRDPLTKSFEPESRSYWCDTQKSSKTDDYFRQY